MSRRDGPTTMGKPFYVSETLRSGVQMGQAEREQRAARALRGYVSDHPEEAADIAEAVMNRGAHNVAVERGLIQKREVAVRRGGRSKSKLTG